jgi:hypothetical protein
MQRLRQRHLLRRVDRLHSRSATASSSCPRRRKPGLGSLADQIALKFGQCAKDVEDQFACAGCGVDVLGQTAKANATLA